MAAFNWFKQESELINPSQRLVQRPVIKNVTEDMVANVELTKGLYRNSYPGLKLAGAMAFAPIAVPVWFMGIPIAKPKDENDEVLTDLISEITKQFASTFSQIHTNCHRDGTIWIWPFFDAPTQKLCWEFIEDDSVVDIVKDLNTKEPVTIVTEDDIAMKAGPNNIVNVVRRRTFTPESVSVEYIQGAQLVSSALLNKTQKNVTGILPISFSNNAEPGSCRGHSDYERFLSDLKNYHDVELKLSELLAKFSVKMVAEVADYEDWKKNIFAVSGITSWADFDIALADIIVNKTGEKTTFIWPQGAHDAAEAMLARIYKKIVESSAVPEIVWGLKTEGNRASVEESMSGLMKYVADKQQQKTEKYVKLFKASIQLLALSTFANVEPDIEVVWNDMDSISPEVKSTIFVNYAQGISALTAGASITQDQLFKLYRAIYPKITVDSFEDFVAGLTGALTFKTMGDLGYSGMQDYTQTKATP
jgi:hypothetical protein